jgi:hypothetical protein
VAEINPAFGGTKPSYDLKVVPPIGGSNPENGAKSSYKKLH